VIGYVKKNFLYNRKYIDLETLNTLVLCWLERTGNNNVHNLTKKRPAEEFAIEKRYLSPHVPLQPADRETSAYSVRKTNQVNYRGNFYSLPMGTYTVRGTQVHIRRDDRQLEIYAPEGTLLCSHRISTEKGKTVMDLQQKDGQLAKGHAAILLLHISFLNSSIVL